MPKLKTHRGAAKRFKKTKSGKLKHRASNRAHNLGKKPAGRKMSLRQSQYVAKSDQKAITRMLNGS